jgi:large subunit ribosomal protein L4
VLVRDDALTWLSLRNVASVHLLAVDQLNTYDVLLSDDVIFTQGAFEAFVNGTAASSTRKATIVEPPAHDAELEDDTTGSDDTATTPVEATPAEEPAEETTEVADSTDAVEDDAVDTDADAVEADTTGEDQK